MSARNPGARARALGSQLRDCRDACDLTVRAAAEELGWDKSTLSRMERGSRQPALEEVGQLLGMYRVTGELRDDILQMTRSVEDPGWWEHGDRGMARATAAVASYESEARTIADWNPLMIPGLLQTEEYARSWMLTDGLAPETADRRTQARLQRQRVLVRTCYTAYIGDSALCSSVGDATTMARQLAALRRVAGWSNVSVRVVPSNAEPHRGQLGPFHLMEFAEVPPVVLIELLGSSLFMDEFWQTEPYLKAVPQLANVALGETESARLIMKMQARWSERERVGEVAQVQL